MRWGFSITQAASGLMSLTGAPETEPFRAGVAVVDAGQFGDQGFAMVLDGFDAVMHLLLAASDTPGFKIHQRARVFGIGLDLDPALDAERCGDAPHHDPVAVLSQLS